MADTYDDLAALADLQPPDARYGRMLVKVNGRWSYPGAPLDGTNLRLPRSNVPDARVLSAIADGAWFAFEVDDAGRPVKAMQTATSPFAGRVPLTPATVGTARAHPPVAGEFDLYRGASRLGAIRGQWLAAFRAGAHPLPTGGNLSDRHLVLEMTAPLQSNETFTPASGDRLEAGTIGSAQSAGRYTIIAVTEPDSRRFILVLVRLKF